MRCIVATNKADVRAAASTGQTARFETEILATDRNLPAPADRSGIWIDHVHTSTGLKTPVLDMEGSESQAYAKQEGSPFNGHLGWTC